MSLSVMADKADEYRQYAQECFEAAERMHSEDRLMLKHWGYRARTIIGF
jgi:hypothetical protein